MLLTGLAALPLAVAAAATLHFPLVQAQQPPKAQTLTLVSYAVTKNAYDQLFRLFADDWKKKTGQTVTFKGSYGGSGSQTRAVIDGLNADIVNLAMTADISRIEQAGLIRKGWEGRLPNKATPIHSTVVAFVRPGNPKKINSWQDLAYAFRGRDAPAQDSTLAGSSLSDHAAVLCVADLRDPAVGSRADSKCVTLALAGSVRKR